MRLSLSSFAWLLRQSIVATIDDGCFGIAKGAAYSALLSFFPVLTSAATILVQTRADFVARTLQKLPRKFVPPGTEDLVVQRFRSAGERPSGLLVVRRPDLPLGRVQRYQEPDRRFPGGIPRAAQSRFFSPERPRHGAGAALHCSAAGRVAADRVWRPRWNASFSTG